MNLIRSVPESRAIFLRMALILAVGIFIPLVAGGVWLEGQVREALTRDREALVESVATATALRVGPLLVAEDYDGIASSLASIAGDTGAVDLLLADGSGQVLARMMRSGGGPGPVLPVREATIGGIVPIPDGAATTGEGVPQMYGELQAWALVDAGDSPGWVRVSMPKAPLLARFDRVEDSAKVLAVGVCAAMLALMFLPLGRAWRLVERRESDLLAKQDELRDAVYRDRLTGLLNRVGLVDRLERALASRRAGEQLLAVCFLDLDGFKSVNDRFGHAVGDLLLVEVARRLSACVRDTDTVARLGGDEFVVLLEGERHPGELLGLLEGIVERVSRQVPAAGRPLRVGVSVGVTVRHSSADTVESLLKQADEAMYEAKRGGRNRWVLHGSVSGDLFPQKRQSPEPESA